MSRITDPQQMPSELYDYDRELRWLRSDTTTRGQAQACFSQEWGIPFTEVRITKNYMYDPGPMCECGSEATVGLIWDKGELGCSKQICCRKCQERLPKQGYKNVNIRPCSLEEATPYDGWNMLVCSKDELGATAYWHGEVRSSEPALVA